MAVKRRNTKAKNKAPAVPQFVSRAIAILTGPGRTVTLALLIVALLSGTFWVLWHQIDNELLASDQYQVNIDDLEISPLPDWIRTDPRRQAFGYLNNLGGPLSIIDDDATHRVADAFSIHPWVEQVIQVTKHYPARICVKLKYRRPVCMVHGIVQGKEGLRAVDVHGVWLPGNDFDLMEAARYPIVAGITSEPVAGLGDQWRDERVLGAAQIAAVIGPAWHELKLHCIRPAARVRSGSRMEYTYEL
ncbi:MAG: hypothetical protein JW888_00135, partial [Pirellulales bacterium]|nr:hypothetical protein [Pirellulales bacterium]